MSSRFKKILIAFAVVGVLILVGFIPYSTAVVPEWSVKVVDKDGRPQPGIDVVEFCESFTLWENPCYQASDRLQITDQDGVVTFSAKYVTLSLWSRFYRSGISVLLLAAHGSIGNDVRIMVKGDMIEYVGGPQPTVVVID